MNPKKYPNKRPRALPISRLRPTGVRPGASDGVKNKQRGADISS